METNYSYHFEYNQKEAIDNRWDSLDCTDLVILGFLKQFSTKAKKITHFEGRDYFWVNAKFLIQQLPTTRIKSERNMRRRLDNLVEAGALLKLPDSHNYPSYAINFRVDKNVHLGTDMSARVDKDVHQGWTDLSNDNQDRDNRHSSKKKEVIKKDFSSDFLAFWSIYPKKSKSQQEQCYKEWCNLSNDDKRIAKYIVKFYSKDMADYENGRYIKTMLTYLQDEVWKEPQYQKWYDGHSERNWVSMVDTYYDGWEDEDRPNGMKSRSGVERWDSFSKKWVRC